MKKKGYILWHRQAEENFLHPLSEGRKFTKFEAWMDLVLQAYHQDSKQLIQGKSITVERGSFVSSDIKLAERWKWHRTTVSQFLKLMESEKMIKRVKINPKNAKSCTRVIINKYNNFQPKKGKSPTTEPTMEPTMEPTTEPTLNKELKELKEIREILEKNSLNHLEEPFLEWIEYKKDRKEKYKSDKSILACANKLNKLSGGNKEIAKEMIKDAMASNYMGFFALKGGFKNESITTGSDTSKPYRLPG